MKKALYLQIRGGRGDFGTDLNYHRLTTIEDVNIIFDGVQRDLYFEFGHWTRYTYRTTNKRTGAPLKKAVRELVNANALHIDTYFETEETNPAGYTFKLGRRLSALEKIEIYDKNRDFTRANILDLINKYSTVKYDAVVIIEEEAAKIINRAGGFREKEILKNGCYFQVSETWNDEHKIVVLTEKQRDTDGHANACAVDLITGKITG